MSRVPHADDAAREVARLATRYELPAGAGEQLLSLVELLARDPLAPTTVREPHQAVDDHLADSLVALELDVVRSATTIADLGAGAGFPGLPLAIALPRSKVWLVESSTRKCRFIERAIAMCRVSNACAVHARAESWTDGLARFDLVTARALAPLAVVAEYAAPLLRVDGALVAWRGRREPDSEAAASLSAKQLGLKPAEPIRVAPYRAAKHRHLHLMFKVRETPPGFPRRPGMAQKRPLGAALPASDRRPR